MFNLEKSIADWRKQMLAAGIESPATLDELESHLREEIERQMKSGLNEQKGFWIASGMIGQAGLLQMEFQKNHPAGNMQKQKRVAAVAFTLILGSYALVLGCFLSKADLTSNDRFWGFAAVAAMLISVLVAWHFLPRFMPVIGNKTVQSAIGLAGGISGMVWFFAFVFWLLPRFDFTPGQLTVTLCWALVPVIALPTASFLMIDKSERQHITATNS